MNTNYFDSLEETLDLVKGTDIADTWMFKDLRGYPWKHFPDDNCLVYIIDQEDYIIEWANYIDGGENISIYNGDNGCGDRLTYIFSSNREGKESEL